MSECVRVVRVLMSECGKGSEGMMSENCAGM